MRDKQFKLFLAVFVTLFDDAQPSDKFTTWAEKMKLFTKFHTIHFAIEYYH